MIKRREFLTNGIIGGVLFITFSQSRKYQGGDKFQESDSSKLLQLVRRYGAEFGKPRGGR